LLAPEDLAGHSVFTQHRPVVRLHIGLEDPNDLMMDLQQAFAAAGIAQ